MMERLQKVLASCELGLPDAGHCETLIAAGRVHVDGVVAQVGQSVGPAPLPHRGGRPARCVLTGAPGVYAICTSLHIVSPRVHDPAGATHRNAVLRRPGPGSGSTRSAGWTSTARACC